MFQPNVDLKIIRKIFGLLFGFSQKKTHDMNKSTKFLSLFEFLSQHFFPSSLLNLISLFIFFVWFHFSFFQLFLLSCLPAIFHRLPLCLYRCSLYSAKTVFLFIAFSSFLTSVWFFIGPKFPPVYFYIKLLPYSFN